MPRVASFTSTGTPAPRSTLAELMAQKKLLAEQQGQIAAPRQIESWTQGAAQMAQGLVNAMQQRSASEELLQGREGLAKLRAGINLDTGPTAEQISQAGLYDPEEATRLQQMAVDAVRARREREQKLGDIAAEHTYQDTRESRINERELAESQAATAAETARKQVEHERDLAEGRVKHVTGDEAKALGLNPTRTWEVTAGTSAAKDITPSVPETYREPTPEERVKYGLIEGQPYKMKVKADGSVEPMSIGSGQQPLPSEVGAKLGLADLFLSDFDSIKASAAAGDLTGAADQPYATRLGWGKGGETYRKIRQGTEGLVRLMTGAGMPQSEAEDRARQYEPIITDDAETLVSKLEGLKAAIEAVRGGATFGRKAPPVPGTNPVATEQYTVGQTYTFDDGSQATYKGGNAADPNSWDIIKPGAK